MSRRRRFCAGIADTERFLAVDVLHRRLDLLCILCGIDKILRLEGDGLLRANRTDLADICGTAGEVLRHLTRQRKAAEQKFVIVNVRIGIFVCIIRTGRIVDHDGECRNAVGNGKGSERNASVASDVEIQRIDRLSPLPDLMGTDDIGNDSGRFGICRRNTVCHLIGKPRNGIVDHASVCGILCLIHNDQS